MANDRGKPVVMESLLSEAKIEEVAKRAAMQAATQAIEEMLIRIGLDVKDPVRLQTDFAAIRTIMRDQESIEDMMFLRRFREQMQSFSTKIGYVIIGIFVMTVAVLLALGLRAWFGSPQ